MMLKRTLVTTALATLVLSGCSAQDTPPGPASDSSATSADASAVLAEHGLDGLDGAEIVDELDRMPLDERPDDLMVSVRPDELLVSSGDVEEAPVALPDDRFYVSMAPYVDQTHECFYHSLTTCRGELGGEQVDVEIVTDDGETLVDETATVFDNGFVGFWLPKDVEGTISVTYGDKSSEVDFATDAEAPTCLTTLQLA